MLAATQTHIPFTFMEAKGWLGFIAQAFVRPRG